MPSKNNLSALKDKPRKSILPIAEVSNDGKLVTTKGGEPLMGRTGQVGRPPKEKAEKRNYKITLSLTQAQGDRVKTKAGLASEAAIIYDHLEKTGFF